MEFLDLDLDARYRIYTQTKKVLRKYQKGIHSGKLTSEQFVMNMLNDKIMISILNDIDISVDAFTSSYKQYVDILISIQNNNLLSNKNAKLNKTKPSYSNIVKLRNILIDTGYTLSIPFEYLTDDDIISIEKFVMTGFIDIGNEKIYNYVSKK